MITPHGYQTVKDTLDQLGRRHFQEAWTGSEVDARPGLVSAEEFEAWKRRPAQSGSGMSPALFGTISIAPPRPDQQWPYGDPQSPEYQAERAAHRRLQEARGILLRELESGRIVAAKVHARTGRLESIGRHRWRAMGAEDALRSGFAPGDRQAALFIKVPAARPTVAASTPTKNKGGHPGKADWPAIKERFEREVAERGLPDRTNVDGWQTQADVARWIADIVEREGDPLSDKTYSNWAKTFIEDAREKT